MKNKIRDIPYLGCDQKKIQSSSPSFDGHYLKMYYEYITDRYQIFRKRQNNDPRPWTDNPILQTYKFTNVRREHDRTSKWLIDHISNNPNLGYDDRFYRTILFRLYNKIETAELIHMDAVDFWDNLEKNARLLEIQKNDVFTRAYKTVSLKYQHRDTYPSYNYRAHMLLYVHDFAEENHWEVPYTVQMNGQKAMEWVKQIPGVGDFLGYQLFCDFTYIKEYPISENEFTVAGPGCRAGIDLLFTNKDGMTYEECIFWLRDHFDSIMQRIDPSYRQKDMLSNLPEYDRHMNVQSIENCFCEFSKYCYIVEGKHKNPHKYFYDEGRL